MHDPKSFCEKLIITAHSLRTRLAVRVSEQMRRQRADEKREDVPPMRGDENDSTSAPADKRNELRIVGGGAEIIASSK